MSQIPNLISCSECLLEKGIGYFGGTIGGSQIRNCKEKCANLAKKRGAPFWSWNSKNKRCHLKATNSDPRAFVWMWSGNTDASCAYPTGCPSKSKEYKTYGTCYGQKERIPKRPDMTHSQMLGKVEYGLPAKI